MRSSHSRVRVVRAAVALPEITPDKKSIPLSCDAPSVQGGVDADRHMVTTQQDEIDALCRAEYSRGFTDGQRAISQKVQADFESSLLAERNKIDATVAALREQLTSLYGTMEGAVVKFAFGVAERIIRREVNLDRTLILGQLRESVRRVLGVERLTIRVHPDDLTLVRENKSVIQANGDAIREILVEGDDGLEPGDCVLESDMGSIDARVSTQLKQIENVLFESKVVS